MADDIKSENKPVKDISELSPRAQKQARQALHERKSKERAEKADTVRKAFQAEKDSIVLTAILEKGHQLADMHLKLAEDGVGSRMTGRSNDEGNPEFEPVYFDNNKRVSELDKSAGIKELINYIERQINVEKPEA